MEQGIRIAALAGLGGMFGWGVGDFFAKKTIDEIGDVTSLVLAHMFGTAFLLFVVGYAAMTGRPPVIPTDPADWGGVFFFGVLQAIVYLLVYRGFGKGQLALLNPIFASFSGLTALLSIVFLARSLPAMRCLHSLPSLAACCCSMQIRRRCLSADLALFAFPAFPRSH